MVTHPGTSRARRRVTMLIETSTLLLSQIGNHIIIIIIKKVKIIVTLSIKNTAGALYKSQIKGENRYCLWLRNSNHTFPEACNMGGLGPNTHKLAPKITTDSCLNL